MLKVPQNLVSLILRKSSPHQQHKKFDVVINDLLCIRNTSSNKVFFQGKKAFDPTETSS